jgi:hypothetical protein
LSPNKDKPTTFVQRQLNALDASATVAANEPIPAKEMRSEANAFIWASVRRWPGLCRGFQLLFKAALVDESRLVMRAATELAINAAWVVDGHGTNAGLYSTTEERAIALEEDSRAGTLTWWEAAKAHSHQLPVPKAMAKTWDAALVGAKKPRGLPNLHDRAAATQSPLPLLLYDFAYRADSDVTHSNTWSLISNVRGRPQFMPDFVVLNATMAGVLVVAAGAIALNSSRLEEQARRLQEFVPVTAAR